MSSDKYATLERTLHALVGERCWSVLVQSGLDNGVTLSIGERQPRTIPLTADTLTPEQRAYIGAYELTVADCTWRLDSPDEIVTSWADPTTGQQTRLALLVGVPVAAWEITWPGLDLTLHFENQLTLRLFCDQTDPTEGGHNYSLLAPGGLFHVGVRSQLAHTPPR